MSDDTSRLLRGVIGQNNDVNPAIAMYGAGATERESQHAELVARMAWQQGYLVSSMPRDDDLARVRVTPAGQQYLAARS